MMRNAIIYTLSGSNPNCSIVILFITLSAMSEVDTSDSKDFLQFSIGVFKIDHMAAGFPDLRAIAEEWSKDHNFKELIIRGVSDTNYGIQFIYISKDPKKSIKNYKQSLIDKYGKDFYAWDYHTSQSEGDKTSEKSIDALERMKKMVIRSEAIKLD